MVKHSLSIFFAPITNPIIAAINRIIFERRNEMETVDNRSWKQKIKDGFKTVKYKLEDIGAGVKKTISEHKEETIFFTIFFGPGLLKLLANALRYRRAEKERRRDECDYYDPRTGEHWYTRSPLTASQKLELERRYNNGESKGRILRSMRKL